MPHVQRCTPHTTPADHPAERREDGDRLDDSEIASRVWLLVLAGKAPTNLLANAAAALLTHPDQDRAATLAMVSARRAWSWARWRDHSRNTTQG